MPTINPSKMDTAILSRIAEIAIKEFKRNDLYVAPPPAALSNMHVELLQSLEEDRLDDAGSAMRLLQISRIVDCIQVQPGVISLPDEEPGYLSQVFPKLIDNVKFFKVPLSGDEKRQYEQAQALLYLEPPLGKTPSYLEFCILRSDLEKQEVALLEMQKKIQGLPISTEQKILKSEMDVLQQLCSEKKEALAALDQAYGFTTAEQIVDRAERLINDVPASIRTMLDTMVTFQLTDPVSNVTHVACNFFPSRLADDNWTPLKITREEIVNGQKKGETATRDSDEIDYSQIDSIELEVQTLKCDRPWFWKRLFNNQKWDWETASPPISTGGWSNSENDLIPAFVYALFFYQNLTIKTQPSVQPTVNLEKLQEALSSGVLFQVATAVAQSPQPRQGIVAGSVTANIAQPLSARSLKAPMLRRDQPDALGQSGFPDNRPRRESGGNRFDEILGRGFIRDFAGRGRVLDEQGLGIYQASVTLESNSRKRRVRTGQDGYFVFPAVSPGSYRVHVEKPGFTPIVGTIQVPQSEPEIIKMSPTATCQIKVRLQVEKGEPFVGAAKVLIQSKDGHRVESMDQRSEAIFRLPPGDFTISVTSPQAEGISPLSANVKVTADCSESPALTFVISSASVLRIPGVSLLGVVCQKVPRSPDPKIQ